MPPPISRRARCEAPRSRASRAIAAHRLRDVGGPLVLHARVLYRDDLHHAERSGPRGRMTPMRRRPASSSRPRSSPASAEREAVDRLLGGRRVSRRATDRARAGQRVGHEALAVLCRARAVARAATRAIVVDRCARRRSRWPPRSRQPRPGRVDATGRLSLLGSAELIGGARVLVTNDSAPLHLASAMGTPTVAIFGPTVPEFGFGPLAPRLGRRRARRPRCRPCHPHGPRAARSATGAACASWTPRPSQPCVSRVEGEWRCLASSDRHSRCWSASCSGCSAAAGRMLAVPIFLYVFHVAPKPAIAMSLAVVGMSAFVGFLTHWRQGSVSLRVAVPFGALAMARCVRDGARLASHVPAPVQLVALCRLRVHRGRDRHAPRLAPRARCGASASPAEQHRTSRRCLASSGRRGRCAHRAHRRGRRVSSSCRRWCYLAGRPRESRGWQLAAHHHAERVERLRRLSSARSRSTGVSSGWFTGIAAVGAIVGDTLMRRLPARADQAGVCYYDPRPRHVSRDPKHRAVARARRCAGVGPSVSSSLSDSWVLRNVSATSSASTSAARTSSPAPCRTTAATRSRCARSPRAPTRARKPSSIASRA